MAQLSSLMRPSTWCTVSLPPKSSRAYTGTMDASLTYTLLVSVMSEYTIQPDGKSLVSKFMDAGCRNTRPATQVHQSGNLALITCKNLGK